MMDDDARQSQDLERLRLRVRPMLQLDAVGDAVYAYYALHHDPHRTRLTVHENDAGLPDGFVAVCQTGRRLFEPTVLLRTPDTRAAVDLLRQALVPGRPYHLITTPDLRDVIAEVVDVEQSEINHVYRLDLQRLPTEINVLVQGEQAPDGHPRFVVRSQGEVAAASGVNWASSRFVEVYAHTRPASRGRGWGRAVLTACTTWVVRSARQPLYVVARTNEPSVALAKTAGYTDTGVREFSATGTCR